MSRIRPCATADELLRQLCLTFETLTRDEKIYQYSLRDDLTFRFSVAGPGVAGNIIEECFDQDLRETVRLHTYESRPGKMYCMLSEQANFTDRIKPQIHGRCIQCAEARLYRTASYLSRGSGKNYLLTGGIRCAD